MFESLKEYDYILVTGPQRSGTRIGAKCIAHDTGHEYVDEAQVCTDSLYRLTAWLQTDGKYVIQCPALCHHVHFFGDRDDVMVVIMKRNVEDIIASQERVYVPFDSNWIETWEPLEKFVYNDCIGYSAAAKYVYWVWQKTRIKHWMELQYEALSKHELWVPRDKRVGWKFNQTEEKDD